MYPKNLKWSWKGLFFFAYVVETAGEAECWQKSNGMGLISTFFFFNFFSEKTKCFPKTLKGRGRFSPAKPDRVNHFYSLKPQSLREFMASICMLVPLFATLA